ncbi:mycothiol synthase [Gulosibacter molinativorax]|nr:mycothiol synthase [Gulosibacter molinativorax]QUY63846.1 Mycothiol acetyltransferase [Gulosibacter molinativorax]
MPVKAVDGGTITREFPEFARAVELTDGVAAFNEDTALNLDKREAHTIEIEDQLAALALSHRLEDGTLESELAVHPQLRGRGLGSQLLQTLRNYARESGNGALQLWAHGNLPGAQQLAGAQGFANVRTLYQLEKPLNEDIAEPTLENGERIRPFERARDGEDWIALNAQVFATHPEQGALQLADLDARIAQDWFDTENFLILESERGEMLGYNWLKVTPEEGEIYVIGVAAKAAGHGYGTALMQAGERRLRERGVATVALYVDGENERAVALYRRLGYSERTVDVQYRANR